MFILFEENDTGYRPLIMGGYMKLFTRQEAKAIADADGRIIAVEFEPEVI